MVCYAGPCRKRQLYYTIRECLCVRRGLWKLTSTMINFSDTMAETGFLARALFASAPPGFKA